LLCHFSTGTLENLMKHSKPRFPHL
jgi:hypothetical protein